MIPGRADHDASHARHGRNGVLGFQRRPILQQTHGGVQFLVDEVRRGRSVLYPPPLDGLDLLLGGPPYNLVLHTAPVAGQVESTYHWHWEIHPRLREIAGLELGTGLPVNSVSPEEAADQLVRGLGRQVDDDRPDPRSGRPGGRP